MDTKRNINTSADSSNFGNTRKRHCYSDEIDDEGPTAKIVVEETAHSLESFCDEVLIEIFKNLDGNSLDAIGKTCVRFYLLVTDHRLWKNIDLTSEALSLKIIRERLRSMHSQTESIRLRGLTESYPLSTWKNITLSENLLLKIKETCQNLQILEFHHSFINLAKISITDFPKNIKKLLFNTCYVKLPQTHNVFFTRIDTHFERLEELSLEYCNWFETHDLVLFSKIPTLKRLCLRGCDNLRECVPYGSIAARFGFKKLEHLDVRETPISDSDIQCFAFSQTLKELFMECPLELRDTQNTISRSNNNPPTVEFEYQTRRRPTFREAQETEEDEEQEQQQQQNNTNNINNSEGGSSSNDNCGNNHQNQQRPSHANEWVILSPHNGRIENYRAEDNLIHIVVNDYSYINIQPTSRNNQNPGIQLNIRGDSQPNSPGGDINRAISRSLWFERRYAPPLSPPRIHPISDRGICGFGSPRHPIQAGIVWIRVGNRPVDHLLEKLIVRHYKQVTDMSLCHLAHCSPNLVYLDLTGTSVTKCGIAKFREMKSSCVVVADHLQN